MAGSGDTKKPHALFVAVPFQGHLTPSANLALKLAAKGFVVTFVTTDTFCHLSVASGALPADDHHNIFTDDARSKGFDIRYELVSDGLPASFDRTANLDQVAYAFLHLLPGHVEDLMRKLLAEADPPFNVLIADTFFVWPSTLAKKFGLPYVSFWTEPALVFALYYHMPLLIHNGHFAFPPTEKQRKDTITYIPGVPAIEPTDLLSYFQYPETAPWILRMTCKAFEEVKGADFVLCNTVQELEAETIAALQQDRPFYAVGPIVPDGFTGGMVVTNLWPETDCSEWLNSMPTGSVLYISFGSLALVSKRDMEEIAHGVLNSKASFIWVVRPGTKSEADNPLPDGFMEACRGRGFFVPWCSQKQVLQHPAVGGFLTHCGWNSILESMWCGVPMLCFPLFTDQPTNRKLVVQNLRVGKDIGSPGEVNRDEVSSRINDFMAEEVRAKLRREMEQVQMAVKNAVTPGGSSCKNLDKFTADLLKHIAKEKSVNNGER